MAMRLPDPASLESQIKLMKSDPTGETWVRVKQATTGDNYVRSGLWANAALEWDDAHQGKVKQYTQVSAAEIVAVEVRLALLESNIEDENGKPLFPALRPGERRDIRSFEAAWSKLPLGWADEIYEAVLAVNPQWDRRIQSQGASLGEL